MEKEGLEPSTLCLQGRCAPIAPQPHVVLYRSTLDRWCQPAKHAAPVEPELHGGRHMVLADCLVVRPSLQLVYGGRTAVVTATASENVLADARGLEPLQPLGPHRFRGGVPLLWEHPWRKL